MPMDHLHQRLSRFGVLCLLIAAAACSERNVVTPDSSEIKTTPPLDGMVISNPQTIRANSGSAGVFGNSAESIIYISLSPGTLPDARKVAIHDRTLGGASYLVNVVNGGFDPVPLEARADDILDLTVFRTSGSAIALTVKAAHVYFETMMDLPTAATTTDDNGRYALCRLPSLWLEQTVYVVADGYPLAERTVSVVPGVLEFDIQLSH